ncbi:MULTISPECIES: squalene/phytoene synthase family protein [Rhodanobacter]|uniref:squalene/phytoene synthase family protein n=1 Tax=Rhodanobacter TaxID=75309 RepID=UPI0004046B03|nr:MULTISPECIES: squalene/phytoene synthase family protein [Rhodanobacter]KZC18917.1 phytoene synthase [Rhodanobacter denitrificans]UJJ52249.1 squalene/phytoene synthase family protein [Rhodanobacter denitrificans]UJM94996.1 squalene/phytoene synthase family protein [Rhodanobacter denitrificans]UJM98527.1 squalene/phytoene synthase family protein [Rhodanobacter denitrificans]UJN22060.1 squalene/phytoene synthase family protein [Rhodanobacter denitrificans]
MIELVEQNAVLQGFIDKWLAVQPRQRVALAFVDGRRYPGHIALAALEQELLGAAYGIREPQVATAKLNWWAEELAGAPASGGRHPLSQVLFDDERAHAIASELWLAPVLAAMAQLEQGTAADFPAQVEAALPLHGALAALETAWWYGAEASPARASRVAVLNHLLHALLRLPQDVERDRLPLPMARLARHGLSRVQLRSHGAARQQAIKAQLDDLLASWQESATLAGPLSVFRVLESRHACGLARRAARAGDALAVLQAGQSRTALTTALQAWQAARAWRRYVA